MAKNLSFNISATLRQKSNDQVIIVEVLVFIFLYINLLMITTFFQKDVFCRTMRYILFISSLMCDCLILIITNALLILSNFQIAIPMWLCLMLFFMSSFLNFITPLTLTAMTLERYVAICMPLRHGQLCSTRSALQCILVIHGLSFIPCAIMVFIVFASVSLGFYYRYASCSMETIIIFNWQGHLRSAISQFYFLVMFSIIVFSYIKIMKVAKAVSAEDKKASLKGLRTVILHTFQLVLCLIQLWCPVVEDAILHINYLVYLNVRYCNYILFMLAPRCLSPLIYGLRDEMFYHEMKNYALCGLYKNKSMKNTV